MRIRTLAALTFLAAGMTCQAGIITYDFSGTISAGSSIAAISTGDTFSGSFSYDTSTSPYEFTSDQASYNDSLFTLTIGSYSFSLGSVVADVGNDVPGGGSDVSDYFLMQGTENLTSGPFAPQVSFIIVLANLGISSVGPLTSTALPPDLAGFSGEEVQIQVGGNTAGGTITSLTLAPEPSGFLLGLTGLGAAALLMRRRNQARVR